jgi:hypothetical protein
MADPHSHDNQSSPISSLLRSLGLTREDLVLHTEQMRAYLSQGSTTHPIVEPVLDSRRSSRRSRTASFTNSLTRNPSPTPPRTPVKSEPTEPSIPTRQMDTMQMVIERKSKQAKREKRGACSILFSILRENLQAGSYSLPTESQSHSRDSRRVTTVHNVTPSRSATPQVSMTRHISAPNDKDARCDAVCTWYTTSLQILQ